MKHGATTMTDLAETVPKINAMVILMTDHMVAKQFRRGIGIKDPLRNFEIGRLIENEERPHPECDADDRLYEPLPLQERTIDGRFQANGSERDFLGRYDDVLFTRKYHKMITRNFLFYVGEEASALS